MTGESIYDVCRCGHFRRGALRQLRPPLAVVDVEAGGECPCPTWTLARKAG